MKQNSVSIKSSFLFIIVLSGIVFYYSCSKQSDLQNSPTELFHSVQNLKSTTLISGDILKNTEQILLLDSLLIIHDKVEVGNDYFLYSVFDLNNESILGYFGREGRGPEEYYFPSFMSRISGNKSKFGIHNSVQSQFNVIEISYSSNRQLNISESKFEISPNYFRIGKSGNNFVGTGRFQDGRYAISNDQGKITKVYGDYPFQNELHLNNFSAGMAFQSRFAFHYEGNKAVSATSASANLEILELTNGELKTISKHHSYPPQFEDQSQSEEFISVVWDTDNYWGYHNIDVSYKYIYALYSGRKIGDSDRFFYGDKILVFDWNGNPIIQLNLDKEVSDITVSKDDTGIYGITTDEESGESEIIYFQIKDF